jgi:metalloendopeptidase OMA1, mitochondrial
MPTNTPGWGKPIRLLAIVAIVAAVSTCGGCALEEEGEGPGHRPQQLALTPDQELELGREAYRQVLAEARGRILPADHPEVQRCRQVGRRIVRAAGIEPLQREINLHLTGNHFEWQLNVIESRQINAFCLPAGKMIVFSGILQITEDDDQLATVLSHEIAHALAHHVSERVAREQSGVAGLLVRRAYDRQQESEADHIGVFLMTFAGYDPHEAVRFWERMQWAHGAAGQVPEVLSDHPSDSRRIRDLQNWVPLALGAKQAFDEGRIVPARTR